MELSLARAILDSIAAQGKLGDDLRARILATRSVPAPPFVDAAKGVPDVEAAWQGAREIVAERIAENADVQTVLSVLTRERERK